MLEVYFQKLMNSGLSLTHKPHIICIVETCLNESILDSELCIDNYDAVRLDHNRHGGGV